MSDDEVVHLTVIPEDGLCEGCHEPIGENVYETEDMIVVCEKCWNMLLEDDEERP